MMGRLEGSFTSCSFGMVVKFNMKYLLGRVIQLWRSHQLIDPAKTDMIEISVSHSPLMRVGLRTAMGIKLSTEHEHIGGAC